MTDRDEWEDEEWPDEDEDDSAELVPCPHCGEDIYEEAEQCPYCGEYVVHNTGPLHGRPLWYVALAVAGIIAVIVVFSGLAALL